MAFEGFVDYDFTMGLVGGCSSDEEESAGPVAVNHSFGRGQFKEMAEKFVIPEPVLEDIIKRSGKSSWSDSTCGVGGATTKMGGVRGARPKGVGRARALKMRAERPPLPHPGRQDIAQTSTPSVGPVPETQSGRNISQSSSTDATSQPRRTIPTTVQTFSPPSENTYDKKWPSLQAASRYTKKCYGFDDTTSDDSSVIVLGSCSSQEESGQDVQTQRQQQQQQQRPIGKKKQKRNWSKYRGMTSVTDPKVTLPPQVVVSTEVDRLGWAVDDQTLCLANLPASVTTAELRTVIESSFGEVTNCKMFKQYHSASVQTAYFRMMKQSVCESVVGYFDGNTYDTESTLQLTCYKLHTGHVTS